jgi:predicted nucleic acid-binding protein
MRHWGAAPHRGVIVDTGPLVALLNASDRHHAWIVRELESMAPPLVTCEAVLAEAGHLVRLLPGGRVALLEMLEEGFLKIGLQLATQAAPVLALIKRYASVPMSLADACIVRLAELHANSRVCTLDNDFAIYRKNGRQVIPLLTPR